MKKKDHLPPVGISLSGLILSLGGYSEVAELCQVKKQAVYAWTTIPNKHVRTLAEATGKPITDLRPDLQG